MPVIKSAIKKLRQDKKRQKQNDLLRDSVKNIIRSAKKSRSGKTISGAYAAIDKASKNKIIHKNKAARLKSSLAKIAKPVKSKTVLGVTSKSNTSIKTKKSQTVKKVPAKTKKTSK